MIKRIYCSLCPLFFVLVVKMVELWAVLNVGPVDYHLVVVLGAQCSPCFDWKRCDTAFVVLGLARVNLCLVPNTVQLSSR